MIGPDYLPSPLHVSQERNAYCADDVVIFIVRLIYVKDVNPTGTQKHDTHSCGAASLTINI